ncbi:Alg9-like mannosyltransferase family-domain-containing protein [Lipomyces tetrasporus]|uniref:Mannosyltransferase n=1 Tax=Lipomyces tetrasporus TaxID=54092 RepID=A0AAD7QTD4_9ASCO|nr:Alg9-like mannosyltransferase family-domain-containing protein [Lipomyces tetrasporus]KAJ8099377.1 Alg9-like mannosyltransferase family-domain-containing protein [Lipomyces tetrasporus]
MSHTMDLLDVLLLVLITVHLVVSPYTKVEESFNLHAIHDLLIHGQDLHAYDHFEFPGVVPRTFIGALVVSLLAKPFQVFAPLPSKLALQYISRGILGVINWASLVYLRRTVFKVFGKTTALWFALLQYTQFHIPYYASRTLPNMFAFPLTMLATSFYIAAKPARAIGLLAFTTIVFRAELLILTATIAGSSLLRRQISLGSTIFAGSIGVILGIAASGLVDSYFWDFPLVPEFYGFYFNAIKGQSANWGTEPWYTYFSLHLPKLLLNPVTIPLIFVGVYVEWRRLGMQLAPYVAFVGVYSMQPHKEWRFIVYVVPVFVLTAATGATWISNRMRKRAIFLATALAILASAAGTLMVSAGMLAVSSTNYPGGHAVAALHESLDELAGAKAAVGDALGNVTVHFDVPVCMSGATLFTFTRDNIVYDRTEDVEELKSAVDDMGVIVTFENRPPKVFGRAQEWVEMGTVKAFGGLALPWRQHGLRFWKENRRWWHDVVRLEERVFIFARRAL